MIIIGYCDWCGSEILEEKDQYGEVQIIYTCQCMEEDEE